MPKKPVGMSIAGSDCSGGAGIQADLKTFSRLGIYGMSAVSAIVAETPKEVLRITPLDPERVLEQVELLLRSFPVAVVKTGMLGSHEVVHALAEWWSGLKEPPLLIVDPVLAATTGDALMSTPGVQALARDWFKHADLITPNREELVELLKAAGPGEEVEALSSKELALAAWEAWQVPCLLTGGDGEQEWVVDYLADSHGLGEFRAKRVYGGPFHGTGCTLSAAIAAFRALGEDRIGAIRMAKRYVGRALERAGRYNGQSCLDHQV